MTTWKTWWGIRHLRWAFWRTLRGNRYEADIDPLELIWYGDL